MVLELLPSFLVKPSTTTLLKGVAGTIVKSLVNEVRGIPEQALLKCNQCSAIVMTCLHCDQAFLLEREPRSSENIKCGHCAGIMGQNESGPNHNPFEKYRYLDRTIGAKKGAKRASGKIKR